MSLSALAPAKLNLFLNIVGRREDGYHLLDSLFVFTELSDKITGRSSDHTELIITGEFGSGLSSDPDNLVQRACAAMREHSGQHEGFSLTLEKNIPVAAGLGGGSADAAAMLRALHQHWHLGWPTNALERLAATLGADVAACVRSKAIMARGIGEVLSTAPDMPPCGILLVNPRVPTPTPAVFRHFREVNPVIRERSFQPLPLAYADLNALVATIAPRGNDLVEAAMQVTPKIGEVLDCLQSIPGAAFANLSGSGATCFALFETLEKARSAQHLVIHQHPDWWTWSGGWSEGF